MSFLFKLFLWIYLFILYVPLVFICPSLFLPHSFPFLLLSGIIHICHGICIYFLPLPVLTLLFLTGIICIYHCFFPAQTFLLFASFILHFLHLFPSQPHILYSIPRFSAGYQLSFSCSFPGHNFYDTIYFRPPLFPTYFSFLSSFFQFSTFLTLCTRAFL